MADELIPLGDRVLVKLEAAETVSKGGILIPETAKEKPLRGRVIAMGHAALQANLPIRVEDIVLVTKYAGTEITLDREEFLLVKAEDIIAKVKVA